MQNEKFDAVIEDCKKAARTAAALVCARNPVDKVSFSDNKNDGLLICVSTESLLFDDIALLSDNIKQEIKGATRRIIPRYRYDEFKDYYKKVSIMVSNSGGFRYE